MGDRINEAKELNPIHDSLYRGGSDASLSAVAPYIFRFGDSQSFSTWYMESGWGDSWGVLLKCSLPMPEVHRHFRKFLLVKTEDDRELYFRFYDPRVLRIFLPTCDAAQIREFFGPVDYFVLEDEDPASAMRFWHENGVLKSQTFSKADLDKNTPGTSHSQSSYGDGIIGDDTPPPKPKSKWNKFE